MTQAQIRVELDLAENVDSATAEELTRNGLASLGDIKQVTVSKVLAVKAQVVFAVEVASFLPAEDLLTDEGKESARELLGGLAVQSLDEGLPEPIISSAQLVAEDGTESELPAFDEQE